MSRRGMTMVELVMVVGIMGLLLALAMPSFVGLVRHTRARGQAATLVANINSARAHAMTSGFPVVVCILASEVQTYRKANPIIPPNQVQASTAPLADTADRVIDRQRIEATTPLTFPPSAPGTIVFLVFDVSGRVSSYYDATATLCSSTPGNTLSLLDRAFTVGSADPNIFQRFIVRADGPALLSP